MVYVEFGVDSIRKEKADRVRKQNNVKERET